MHPAYYLEQVVLGLFGFPLFILFVAHVFENRLDSGKVKHAFHRLGAVASLLLALRSLDSRGFNILRPGLLVTFLNSNLTSCLFIACTAVVYYQVAALRQLVKMNDTVLVGNVMSYLSVTLAIGTVFMANLTTILQLATNRLLYLGVFLLWLACGWSALIVSFNVATWSLLKTIADVALPHMMSSTGRLDRAERNMRLLQCLGTFCMLTAVPVQIWIGTEILSDKTRLPLDDDPAVYNPQDAIFMFIQIGSLCIMMWWSWLPQAWERLLFWIRSYLCCCICPARPLRDLNAPFLDQDRSSKDSNHEHSGHDDS